MGFLRRSTSAPKSSSDVEAIVRFWSWWQAEGAEQIALAIVDHEPERVVAVLTQQVKTIHPGLAWEFGTGTENANLLVVSAEGDPDLRPVARRWHRAAPAADGIWEYSDARPPATDPAAVTLSLGEITIDVASASAWARVAGASLDVAVYHPVFAGLEETKRQLATRLLLDTVLGESAVQTWVGSVKTTTEKPMDPVPLAGLRAVIRELVERFTDAGGDPVWVLLEGSTQDGARVLAGTQVPLRSATAPHLDTYVGVGVPFTGQTPEGLPDSSSATPLQNFSDHLTARLGDSGRLVAWETHGGVRTLHLYVDGGTPAVEQLRPAVRGWDQGRVTITAIADSTWQHVQHLRT